jgi:hypothetical protein
MMNGQNAKGFAEDQGFYLKDIIHGEPEALQILARRTGSNLDELTAASYRLTDPWHYERMGLALPRQTVFSPETRGCLACLREDALKSDLPWQAGMIFRANWHLSHVRVCIRHNLPLVLLWNDKDRLGRHDFASRVGLIFDRIMTRDMDGESIKISGFDRWVDERLQGRKTAIWLDQFDFHAAATFCELLAGRLCWGRSVELRQRRTNLQEMRRLLASKVQRVVKPVFAFGLPRSSSAVVRQTTGRMRGLARYMTGFHGT